MPRNRVRVDWESGAGPVCLIRFAGGGDQYSSGRCTVRPSRAER